MPKLTQSWPSTDSTLLGGLGFLLSIAALGSLVMVWVWQGIDLIGFALLAVISSVLLFRQHTTKPSVPVTLSCAEGIYCITGYTQAPQDVTIQKINLGPAWIYILLNNGQGTQHLVFWRHRLGENSWRSLVLHLQHLSMRAQAIEKEAI